MRYILILLAGLLLVGCAGIHKKGTARFDAYDEVEIEQMVGNNVSGKIIAKTILCLNARRETRKLTAITNQNVITLTNPMVLAITNEIVTLTTNYATTRMTNALPASPSLAEEDAETGLAVTGEASSETDGFGSVAPLGPAESSIVTLAFATNQTATFAPNQTAANTQITRNYNNQVTTTENNVSISLMTNFVVTAETNLTVNYVTNYSVSTATNVTITSTNLLAHDYYLYTELVTPDEFNLFNGESLVLLLDGVRHGFSQTNSAAAFRGRKGFVTAMYAVPPEVLVDIANAKEARVRLRGVNTLIERELSTGSKRNFKAYLLKYFQPEPEPVVEVEKLHSGASADQAAESRAAIDTSSGKSLITPQPQS